MKAGGYLRPGCRVGRRRAAVLRGAGPGGMRGGQAAAAQCRGASLGDGR